ncbi:efflux RND transporter periplasmic adaptor subunit [Myroides phaeus]|nr:efflux RND transporter periplasmic adaptor subunit [Myroides phaeus]
MKTIKIMPRYTLLTAALFSAFLVSCNKEPKSAEQTESTSNCITASIKEGLTFEKVTLKPIEKSLTLNGYVDYNQDKTIPFTSLVDGVVTNTYFSLGDYVKKGQLLAEIKSTDLNEFYDELKSTEAELKVAQRELQSVESMFKDGIASQKELIEAQEDVNVLKSKLNSAKNNLAVFNNADHSGVFKVVAPQAGYIVTKAIAAGMPIAGGEEPLFTIANLEDVWIMANVYATNMRHIEPNLEVKVATLAYPDEYFSGKVSKMSQVFDSEERVLKARIVLENKEMKLKPGMAADIIIQLKTDKGQALAVPNNAIVFDNNQNYVVVYKDECNYEIRKITPTSKNNLYTYISEGVEENETVVTTNELLLYEQLNNSL